MDGMLLIDKAEAWTSFDLVAKVRSLIRSKTGLKVKVGHAGTLDPLATGLVIILIGKYTKKAELLTKKDKTYEVSMKLGEISTTGDSEGQISQVSKDIPSQKDINKTLDKFVGELNQIPPVYSAIKINGVRSYKLAREGKTVEPKPRPVTIYSIDKVNYKYPEIDFVTRVSSGTYIRSLVEDIGQSLGVGAYTTKIRRSSIDNLNVREAVTINDLNKENIQDHLIKIS